ncbi:MAG: hypothetical protein GF309_11520 [Candidatus Lokiarchaeota archaeon]|nr:hypothetical protein [Candidatus Lokiarchaeota archaeon]
MVSMQTRAGWLMVTLGITLLLVSFLGAGSFGLGTSIDSGMYKGRLFRTTDAIYVRAEGRTNKSFSLYIFDSEDTLSVLENGSLEQTNPVAMMENITHYNGRVELPSPGVYAILVTPSHNNTISVSIDIQRTNPHMNALIPGILFVAGGAILSYIPRRADRIEETPRGESTGKIRLSILGKRGEPTVRGDV